MAEYKDVDLGPNPFLRALISAANIRQRVTYDEEMEGWSVNNPSKLYAAFANLDAHCHSLDPFGFPRSVIRAVKKKYAKALCQQIRSQYSEEYDEESYLIDLSMIN